jgi:glycosyltransferase involved in cell wall biosynthesis
MTHDPASASAPSPESSALESRNDSRPLSRRTDTHLPIAFVGTFPPRRCGIATFTRDLANAMGSASEAVRPLVVALTDPGGRYDYPRLVRYEIRQGNKGDYARAAEFVNYSDVRLVSIQHEHGIFGGDDGAWVFDLLHVLRAPAIATLHTVLKHPSDSQRSVIRRLSHACSRLVVMSEVARELLGSSYDVGPEKVALIPHGIPEMVPQRQDRLKARFGVVGRRMLLTFGLLGPNKGIETVIRALPGLAKAFPDVVYFVVGATHPTLRARHGEAYRTSLEREAEALGVRDRLVFRDQFVADDELCDYLQAADIYISPYLNEAQVTSGALSYAMGAGAAVVSTPYWHAREILADNRGRLFPFADHAALEETLRALLGAPDEIERIRANAYELTRSMVWPAIGKAYLELGSQVMAEAPARLVPMKATRASSLPEVRLDHLLRLTDDTGIIQHATFSVPSRRSGYCTDDNARALIVALRAERLNTSPETTRLVTTYLAYLHDSQTDDGDFHNMMSYDRTFAPGCESDDCIGRAIWALGTAARAASDDGHRLLARQMLERALPRAASLGVRGTASTLLGLVELLAAEPWHKEARELLGTLSGELVRRYEAEAGEGWRWFEPTLTYDNALVPLALFRAYTISCDRAVLRVARESIEMLEEVCFRDGQLALVGNAGWLPRGGKKAVADEQALDAAALVLAFRGAYVATDDHRYLTRMRQSFAWFLGANRLGVPLYDFLTAGCRDGLGAAEPNQNEGAESTVSFLLALLEMHELAGEGLEFTQGYPQAAT